MELKSPQTTIGNFSPVESAYCFNFSMIHNRITKLNEQHKIKITTDKLIEVLRANSNNNIIEGFLLLF